MTGGNTSAYRYSNMLLADSSRETFEQSFLSLHPDREVLSGQSMKDLCGSICGYLSLIFFSTVALERSAVFRALNTVRM
jgi:hypothetical protein